MGFTLKLILECDSCGYEDDYCEDMVNVPHGNIRLPDGWKTGYQINDSFYGHVCDTCVEEGIDG